MSRLLERTAAELANPQTATVEALPYTRINITGGTQMRAAINEQTAGEYADDLRRGAILPPIIVFYDGDQYWLGDGFHRMRAHFMAHGSDCTVPAEVRPGTRRDAILCAAGANAVHGLRRTRADKERAVDALLRDEEWGGWSDREIARRCHVSHPFVAERRKIHSGNITTMETDTSTERTFIHHKTGQPATMNVTPQRQRATEKHETPTEQAERYRAEAAANRQPAPALPADLVAAGCTLSVQDGYHFVRYGDRRDTCASYERAVIRLREMVDAATQVRDRAANPPSTLRERLDRNDQVMAAEVAAMLADDDDDYAPLNPHPPDDDDELDRELSIGIHSPDDEDDRSIGAPTELPVDEDEDEGDYPRLIPHAQRLRNDRINRLLDLYRDAATSASEYGDLTGDFTGTLPLRRALEPMIARLRANLGEEAGDAQSVG